MTVSTALLVCKVLKTRWPVNEASTAFTPRLYVRNRRAYWIARGTGPCEGLVLAAVLVAATHVGGAVIDARWLSDRSLPRRGRFDDPVVRSIT